MREKKDIKKIKDNKDDDFDFWYFGFV